MTRLTFYIEECSVDLYIGNYDLVDIVNYSVLDLFRGMFGRLLDRGMFGRLLHKDT